MQRQLGLNTAIFTICASMVGTGIFGTAHIIQAEINNPTTILILWVVGGLIALSGAICYAELSSALPYTGGDYMYLRKIYGKMAAFLNGWISILVGFAAPAAITAMLFSQYFKETIALFPEMPFANILLAFPDQVISSFIILIFALSHSGSIKVGCTIQNLLTAFKLAILLFIIVSAFNLDSLNTWTAVTKTSDSSWGLPELGTGLLLIMFSYSGWNAAAYLGGEVKNPKKNLPLALISATLSVTALYFLINLVFFIVLDKNSILNKETILTTVSAKIFAAEYTNLFLNFCFCIFLMSNMSANLLIGSRICYALGNDNPTFSKLSVINQKYQSPVNAIFFQSSIAIIYILVGTYREILNYMGFILSFVPLATVIGLMKFRSSKLAPKDSFRSPLYPLFPVFFCAAMLFIITTHFINHTVEACVAILVVLTGALLFIYKEKLFKKSITIETVAKEKKTDP